MPSNNKLFPQSERERENKESTVKNEISRYPKLSTSKGHFSIPSASTQNEWAKEFNKTE